MRKHVFTQNLPAKLNTESLLDELKSLIGDDVIGLSALYDQNEIESVTIEAGDDVARAQIQEVLSAHAPAMDNAEARQERRSDELESRLLQILQRPKVIQAIRNALR